MTTPYALTPYMRGTRLEIEVWAQQPKGWRCLGALPDRKLTVAELRVYSRTPEGTGDFYVPWKSDHFPTQRETDFVRYSLCSDAPALIDVGDGVVSVLVRAP